VHELGIGFGGLVITLVVGSFLGYHLYLISYGNLPALISGMQIDSLLKGLTERRWRTSLRFCSCV
jgi:hypothetical protein